MVLKKEVTNTESASDSETVDVSGYRQLLVKTLHQCSIKYSTVAPTIVPVVRRVIVELYTCCSS